MFIKIRFKVLYTTQAHVCNTENSYLDNGNPFPIKIIINENSDISFCGWESRLHIFSTVFKKWIRASRYSKIPNKILFVILFLFLLELTLWLFLNHPLLVRLTVLFPACTRSSELKIRYSSFLSINQYLKISQGS